MSSIQKVTTAVISAEPISIPEGLPPSLYGLEGVLAATLLVRALVDFVNSRRG